MLHWKKNNISINSKNMMNDIEDWYTDKENCRKSVFIWNAKDLAMIAAHLPGKNSQ